MAHVEIIDQTLRDGVQSLWGMRIRAGMVTKVGRQLDRAGYHTVELPSGSFFSVLIRYLKEDPIEAYTYMRSCLRNTRVRGGSRPSSTGRYGISPHSVLDFISRYTIQRLGVDGYWIYDCLFNMPEMEHRARAVYDSGGIPVPAVMYGISPVHTDEWFASRVREMVLATNFSFSRAGARRSVCVQPGRRELTRTWCRARATAIDRTNPRSAVLAVA